VAWPTDDALLAKVPEPVLPEQYAGFMRLYRRSWQMTLELVRSPAAESGLPNAYVGTARKTFLNEMFMWDSCFTAMAYAYGWRAFPHTATLDDLYSFQQDGGYIPRETAAYDALPLLYEPDFSPNPPMPAVAELCFARLTGDVQRLAAVYPVLVGFHRWLQANRRLADGTYWTDGLANGLDNSPSLGEGYPDLTAQMAHAAECLAIIADAIGKPAEAGQWRAEQQEIGAACNAKLWSAELQFYATSLVGGGHNPNKVVTGFWPLWAGIVPAERIAPLARQLLDPQSFWRLHPVPSLAADSPSFRPGGDYWLGSVWAPTNTMVVKGFQRVGRIDLARQVTIKHLQAMLQVFDANGVIWENYSSDRFERGSRSGPDYSWSISGPIRLLIESLLGIEPDALSQTVRWTPIPGETLGLKRLALGPATISLLQGREQGKDVITVATDQPFTLELVDAQGQLVAYHIAPGSTRITP
jgi:glycogen debranching enzyme